jgi:ubiquitin-conjugating enzyme E2 Z
MASKNPISGNAMPDNAMPPFISKDTMKRIISDIKEIRKNPLTEHGIYYEHDDTDLLKGKALIIGPQDTPYADGFYLFKFKFPANYPFAPPVVEFCTRSESSEVRFNPNLYRSGKVCLSILNTWQGEPWSGCQTISSVLLAICTVLNDAPLLNEPGLTKEHRDFNNYNRIIAYKNIHVAIFDMLKSPNIKEEFECFASIMHEYFQQHKEKIRARVIQKINTMEKISETVETGVYQMKIFINYPHLLKKFEN